MNRETADKSLGQGTFFRLADGREIAIYLRDGTAWVAEIGEGTGEVCAASAWISRHGRKLAHAQRRGEIETLEEIPDAVAARIEALHRAQPSVSVTLARFLSALRRAAGFTKHADGCPAA